MNRPEIKSGMVTNKEPGYWFGFGLAVLAQFAIVALIALGMVAGEAMTPETYLLILRRVQTALLATLGVAIIGFFAVVIALYLTGGVR